MPPPMITTSALVVSAAFNSGGPAFQNSYIIASAPRPQNAGLTTMSASRNSASEDLFDLAITGGTVVLSDGPARVNVGVRGDLIEWIGTEIPQARKTVDATGKLVLPGGIDSHCHMDQQPWEGRSSADDFRSGTLSALCGGNTTILPFAMQMRGQSLQAVVDDYHQRAS